MRNIIFPRVWVCYTGASRSFFWGSLNSFDSPKVGSKVAIGMVVGVAAAAEKAGIWGIADVFLRGAAADIIMLMV